MHDPFLKSVFADRRMVESVSGGFLGSLGSFLGSVPVRLPGRGTAQTSSPRSGGATSAPKPCRPPATSSMWTGSRGFGCGASAARLIHGRSPTDPANPSTSRDDLSRTNRMCPQCGSVMYAIMSLRFRACWVMIHPSSESCGRQIMKWGQKRS